MLDKGKLEQYFTNAGFSTRRAKNLAEDMAKRGIREFIVPADVSSDRVATEDISEVVSSPKRKIRDREDSK